MDNTPAFVAAVGASVLLIAHGIVGHFWSRMQLREARLMPTMIIGDDVLAHRMFAIVWHIVTCTFAASAITLYLAAFGAVGGSAILRFISAAHASYLILGGALFATRLDAFLRPIPLIAAVSMLDVAVFAWIAS
jgi:hypothetical protein